MKKSILYSVLASATLGIAATSYGQGYVLFENNDFGTLNAPVTFAPGGERVGSEFTADLLYSLDGGTTYILLTQANAGAGTAYPTAFSGTDGNNASGAGYFFGPNVTIPGYSSGPVNFIVQAYHGSSYVAADIKGQSAPFTVPSLATGTAVPFPGGSMQPFALPIPEPAIFALAGLGAAGLLAFRGKK